MGFTTIDMIIVVVYMAASVGIGSWIGRKQSTTTDYFLGGRDIPWQAVTFSIVATETSVLTFIGILFTLCRSFIWCLKLVRRINGNARTSPKTVRISRESRWCKLGKLEYRSENVTVDLPHYLG